MNLTRDTSCLTRPLSLSPGNVDLTLGDAMSSKLKLTLPCAVSVMNKAKLKYPDKLLRLQPVPNTVVPDNSEDHVYQLHARMRSPKDVSDFKWELVFQGTLKHIDGEL